MATIQKQKNIYWNNFVFSGRKKNLFCVRKKKPLIKNPGESDFIFK